MTSQNEPQHYHTSFYREEGECRSYQDMKAKWFAVVGESWAMFIGETTTGPDDGKVLRF